MKKRLAQAQQALEGLREQQSIQARLRQVGYGRECIDQGEALLHAARSAMERAEAVLEKQRAATEELQRARSHLHGIYRDAVQLTKITLGEDHPWLEQAGIPRRGHQSGSALTRSAPLDHQLHAAFRFFQAVNVAEPSIRDQLTRIGLGPAAVTMARGWIGAVERAHDLQQRRMTEVAVAVQTRANALQGLDEWMSEFTKVVRIAVRERPELLAHIGISPRGRPRKK
jgi:hypothetical protein